MLHSPRTFFRFFCEDLYVIKRKIQYAFRVDFFNSNKVPYELFLYFRLSNAARSFDQYGHAMFGVKLMLNTGKCFSTIPLRSTETCRVLDPRRI